MDGSVIELGDAKSKVWRRAERGERNGGSRF